MARARETRVDDVVAAVEQRILAAFAADATASPAPLAERLRRHFEAARLEALSQESGDAGLATARLVETLLETPARVESDSELERAAVRLCGLDAAGGEEDEKP